MLYQIQLRQDTLENWGQNPDVVLKSGEVALVSTDNTTNYDAYKVGDGVTRFEDLTLFYFIHTDEYGNPVIINPADGTPIDVAYIVDTVTLKDTTLSEEVLTFLEGISNTKGESTHPFNSIFANEPALEDHRTYAIPINNGWFGRVLKIDNLYRINLFKSVENSYTIHVDMVAEYQENNGSPFYFTRIVSLINPFIYYLNPGISLEELQNLRTLISNTSEGNKGFPISYNGKIYNSYRVEGRDIILLSTDTVTDYYGSISYLSITVTTVNEVGYFSSYSRYIKLSDDMIKDFWQVQLPANWSNMRKGETYSVEEIWGSVQAFQDWKAALDPMNTGISLWDVILFGTRSLRGTMGMVTMEIEGQTVKEYWVTLLVEGHLGVYLRRYRIYNNPLNNTVPIGDVVKYVDRYNITNPEYNRIWSDWAINNPCDLGYVRNRTHWIDQDPDTGEDVYHPLDQRFVPELTNQYLTSEEEQEVIDFATAEPDSGE